MGFTLLMFHSLFSEYQRSYKGKWPLNAPDWQTLTVSNIKDKYSNCFISELTVVYFDRREQAWACICMVENYKKYLKITKKHFFTLLVALGRFDSNSSGHGGTLVCHWPHTISTLSQPTTVTKLARFITYHPPPLPYQRGLMEIPNLTNT